MLPDRFPVNLRLETFAPEFITLIKAKFARPFLASIPDKSDKLDNLNAIFCKYTQPIRSTDLRDAIMVDEGIKKSMANRRIREAKEIGVLIENNVGLLYYKGKEVNNESDQLPF